MENENTPSGEKMDIAGVVKKKAVNAEKAVEAFLTPIAERAGQLVGEAIEALPANGKTILFGVGLGIVLTKLFEAPKRHTKRKTKR